VGTFKDTTRAGPLLQDGGSPSPWATPIIGTPTPRKKTQRAFFPNIPNAAAVLFLMDLVSLSTANLLVIYQIRTRLDIFDQSQVPLYLAVSALTTLLLLYAAGCYRREALVRFSTAMIPLGIALGFSAAVLTPLMHFVLGGIYTDELIYRSISRSATLALLSSGISLAAGMANRLLFFAMSRRHWFQRNILVVGTGARARYLFDLLSGEKYRGFAALTFVSESVLGGPAAAQEISNDVILSSQGGSIHEMAASLRADSVVVAAEHNTVPLEPLLTCKAGGIPVCEFNTFIERETGRVDLRWVDLSWLVYSNGFEIRPVDVFLKRLTDIVGAAIMLWAAFPVLVMAAIAITLEGRGPILFRQTRVTQGGRTFNLFKLRTMRVDAEKHGAQWAAEKDPRITPVGSILRRFRIDEIPQLINVLRGEMSLVGPRPERPVFVEQLAKEIAMYNLRHSVKAGITGWAQLNYPYGASVADARCKLEYDLFYMKHFSVLRDLGILLQTCRIVLWPQGVR
jgi:sugar transferase (PEP-CTERM system associated)